MASMARALLSAASVLAIAGSVQVSTGAIAEAASSYDVAPNPVWPRPIVSPIPQVTNGVADPVQNMDGTWKIAVNPPADFWSNDVDPAAWSDVTVPGQPTMQGLEIRQNVEFAYKRKIHVPADFAGKRIVQQFDGVSSYARLWVNGQLVRDHTGGFTTWDADITAFVTPGADAWITVGVTDQSDDIANASGYAHNLVGGILRDVRLLALPAQALTRFDIDTQLDSSYTNAVMRVYVGAAVQGGTTATVALRLLDPLGVPVPLDPSTVDVTSVHPEVYVDIPVAAPRLWDSEHPWLYSLQATEYVDGQPVESVTRQIGFRQIDVSGNKLLVNGHEVKLRGVNHHHISPTEGRSTASDLDVQDIKLMRAANVNLIRTSHYPPTSALLAAADRYGMLIDEETAVTSQSTSSDDANRKAAYLNQFAEMIARDRSHPSVIMWSLGNESWWGANFGVEYSYAKAEDLSRPVIFSDGGINKQINRENLVETDIVSVHYPGFAGPFGGESKPVLYDEYAPLPASTIDSDEQRRDPNVENWWGASIKPLWQHIFDSDGALGGAIWAGIDDVFLMPKGPAGYGEWGLLDVWRRDRPAYWLTKKAYSSVRHHWQRGNSTTSARIGMHTRSRSTSAATTGRSASRSRLRSTVTRC
jgi:beta-galactosidase/beta-glucuronidase